MGKKVCKFCKFPLYDFSRSVPEMWSNDIVDFMLILLIEYLWCYYISDIMCTWVGYSNIYESGAIGPEGCLKQCSCSGGINESVLVAGEDDILIFMVGCFLFGLGYVYLLKWTKHICFLVKKVEISWKIGQSFLTG